MKWLIRYNDVWDDWKEMVVEGKDEIAALLSWKRKAERAVATELCIREFSSNLGGEEK